MSDYNTVFGEILKKAVALRHELHMYPELSGQETQTIARLENFIQENTAFSVVHKGSWFYAFREGTSKKSAIAFRADMDALPIEETVSLPYASVNPGVSHKCGHDGHSATLCALAMLLSGTVPERSVYLVFQPAEETGKGGATCAEYMAGLDISEIYAWHNSSSYPLGSVALKAGTMQCASKGLTAKFTGKNSHASEPENGINPAFAIAELVQRVKELSPDTFSARTLYTIVDINVGTKDFGISPGYGEISFTLRADMQEDLEKLESIIRDYARMLAAEGQLQVEFEISDPFPETANNTLCAEKIMKTAEKLGCEVIEMSEPWKASEDFGYYTKVIPGAIFFVGSGEEYPPLHTVEYDFNDRTIETALRVMQELALA